MGLSPSQKVLLAVIRRQPDAEYPLGAVAGLDREQRGRLAELLRGQALAGWAHRVFAEGGMVLPADLREELSSCHSQNTARAILALRDHERISRVLTGAGVRHVALKGIRLLETLYPDPGTRAVSDVDVLVRREDVGRADEALRGAGWRGEGPGMWERQERFHHHHGYEPPAGAVFRLELHWKVASGFSGPLSGDELWGEATTSGDSLEFELSPAVQLSTLLMHIASHGYNASPKWLLDVRLLLERRGAPCPAPWPPRSSSPLFFALSLVSSVCGCAEAGELARRVRPWALRARTIEALAAPERFLGASLLRGKWPQYAFFVALNDRPIDRARLAYRAVAYKLGVEGVSLPRWLDRVVGGGS